MDHAEVVDAFDGGTELAKVLSERGWTVDRETIYAWKRANSIPATYWIDIVAAAKARNVSVTLEDLAAEAARRRRRRAGNDLMHVPREIPG